MNTDYVLVLRTCNSNLTSFNGFKWPESGPVSAPHWDPAPVCGHGLHGLLWGEGSGSLLDWGLTIKWLVVKVLASEIVDLIGKVKFPRGEVVFCGDQIEATNYLVANSPPGKIVVGAHVTVGHGRYSHVGDHGTATAGIGGTAMAGDNGTAIVGYGGTASTGTHGRSIAGSNGTAITGAYGNARVSFNGTATAGDYGSATAGDYGTAKAGNYGTAKAGNNGTVQAGANGKICILWWSSDSRCVRFITGYVGENGIEPNVPYCASPNEKLVKKPA